jgi:hypothetical protein
MKTRSMSRITVALSALALLALVPRAHACATCFGASDSKLAQGMNLGILVLLGVVVVVLAGLASFFVTLAVRSARTHRAPAVAVPVESAVQS